MTSTSTATAGPSGDGDAVSGRPVLSGYAGIPGRSDELRGPDGAIRPRWKPLAAELDALGPTGLLARRTELNRLLRNEGATYNVTDQAVTDRQATQRRPWSLDPCPLILDPATWAGLESAVAQRTAILDMVLGDIYGSRLLIERGLIPPEMVFGHPAFLRPCDGIAVPGGHRLFTTAVDVIRDPSGDFRVIGDRAQAPSGLGYALVNRTILSRVLPNLHRQAGVERLAGFFRSIRAGMAAVAPDGVDDPRVVILTPGPHTETYFEHAYLAAYLGYALVEGRDLEVRNNRVWVRSLTGFDPVDVVIRRVDDQWCDPVELRADSLLGVPGLIEAVRRGRVTVVNPLGAAVIENPALTCLLDRLAPALLGEELALRGPQTWWCGQSAGLSHVLANLDQVMILPVRPSVSDRPVATSTLSSAELVELADRIRSCPAAWVGQEVLEPSTTPTVTDTGGLEPRPVVLRTFLVAEYPANGRSEYGFTVLPGGLTRAGDSADSVVISSRSGGTSKDTWVASPEPALQQSAWLRAALSPVRSVRRNDAGTAPPSRVAAQLFVLGRTAEHAELVIRLIRTVLARLDQPFGVEAGGGAESLRVLLAALQAVSRFDPVSEPGDDGDGPPSDPDADRGDQGGAGAAAPTVDASDPTTDRRALALVLDAGVDGSLASSLRLLIDAAYSVREQLSGDTWQLIGDVEEELARLKSRPPTQLVGVQAGLQRLLQALLALAGLSAENMERDPTWLFLDGGRRLERAQSLVKLVRALLAQHRAGVIEDLLLESLLKTSESLIIFKRRARSTMQVAGAVDLLIYDAANPRSVIFQLDRLLAHLGNLPKPASTQRLSVEEQLVLEAATVLRLTDADRLAAVDAASGRRPELDSVLGRVDELLAELLDSLRRTYFAHERLSALDERNQGLGLEAAQGST